LAGLIAARFSTAKGRNWHSRAARYWSAMLQLDDQQQAARDWFESLRDRICAAFEEIEREAGSNACFAYVPWERSDPSGEPGGGGVRGQMSGEVFEKVGVNVSTVGGRFSPEFARTILGADESDPSFFATGISLVAHMANPHVPAVHMNTRFLTTTKRWFGGGADLNPAIPYDEDTEAFHARLRAACAAHDPTFYPRFAKWADEYFFLPHRNVSRGVGGIFYDHLECLAEGEGPTFNANFAFTREVGEAFLDIFPKIVRRRMNAKFDDADMGRLLEFRGRYVEFNLLYDRGTLFGLKTGGNIDAILMSLPPLAAWK
jgi:coproporphyrinogen III oxidase